MFSHSEIKDQLAQLYKRPMTEDRNRIITLLHGIDRANKKLSARTEMTRLMMTTGRMTDAFGQNILVCDTPDDAYVVVNSETQTVVGNFDSAYSADDWARKQSEPQKWLTQPLTKP